MPVSIQIFYDNPNAVFYPGQIVSGWINLVTDKMISVRSISMNIKGEARVYWSERRKRHNDERSHTVHYTAHEVYFENTLYLAGGSIGEITLPPGQSTHVFQCALPHSLPSSLEGQHGYIRYTVLAALDRPRRYNSTAKAAFTIISPLDLNAIAQVKEPVTFGSSKQFCCLLCKSGPLTIHASLPVSGVVPGQTIPFSVQIENASTVRVTAVNCGMHKEVKWHATSPHRKTKVTLVPLAVINVNEEIPGRGSKLISKSITIPSVPPPTRGQSGIIDLDYIFQIEAVVDGCHINLGARLPLIVGTIPLLTGPTAFRPAGGEWTVPPAESTFASAPLQSELPPPSYEESVWGVKTIRDSTDNDYTMGNMDFAPRYPVWNYEPYTSPATEL